MKPKSKLILLEILSFVVSITPILVVVICKWEEYVPTTYATCKLTIGLIASVIFMALKAMGRLKFPEKRVVSYSIVFIMAYLLSAIMKDIVLLSGMALLGEIVDLIFLQRPIKKLREEIVISKTSDAVAKKVEETVSNLVGKGRV